MHDGCVEELIYKSLSALPAPIRSYPRFFCAVRDIVNWGRDNDLKYIYLQQFSSVSWRLFFFRGAFRVLFSAPAVAVAGFAGDRRLTVSLWHGFFSGFIRPGQEINLRFF